MAFRSDFSQKASSIAQKPSAIIGGLALVGLGGASYFLARSFLRRNPDQLSQAARAEFIDKCTGRWLFEKTGVRLYDTLITKSPPELRDRLQHFRDEEKEHEEMLEDVIRKYGADPHATTPSSRITEIQSKGIVEVIENEGFDAGLDALLAAELVDNANWDLLAKLARKVGDADAYVKFNKAMVEEAQHLYFIRKELIKEAEGMLKEQHQSQQEPTSVH